MKISKRWIALLFNLGYAIFIWYKTVFSRIAREKYRYDFHPFWSYKAIMNGREELIKEHFFNISMFIPIGIMLWYCFERKKWWIPLLFGSTLSLSIEVMQFFLKKGFAEFDDVMHNTLGCVIGYGIYKMVASVRK